LNPVSEVYNPAIRLGGGFSFFSGGCGFHVDNIENTELGEAA
jgi:hypothetical protein